MGVILTILFLNPLAVSVFHGLDYMLLTNFNPVLSSVFSWVIVPPLRAIGVTNRVYITRHVRFFEDQFPYPLSPASVQSSSSTSISSLFSPVFLSHSIPPTPPFISVDPDVPSSESFSSPSSSSSPYSPHIAHQSRIHVDSLPTQSPNLASSLSTFFASSLTPPAPSIEILLPSLPTSHHPMVTRSKAGITKSNSRFQAHQVSHLPPEPSTFLQASKSPQWVQAMQE